MSKKPEFLSNKPLGVDLFDGKSQDKISEAIKQHIIDVDAQKEPSDEKEAEKALPRIIGIEGSWGSGKSNTLLQLEEKLGAQYYFFTYDAWGNQEDLQRRSLLQLLTNKLIKDGKLTGTTQIKIISSALDVSPQPYPCTWQERVDNLTSRKSSTHNITVPTIYDSTKYFALMVVITGILVSLLNAIKVSSMPCWYTPLAIALAFVPLTWYCLLMCYKIKKRKKITDPEEQKKLIGWSWKEMWQMYQTSGRTDTSTYTVSEIEPTVTEFRKWMTDLSNALEEGIRLVIVFDNMDRLPQEKVRQLWSSIQTFFADKGYPKVWCIIPFDRKHLANAFSDAKDNEQLTNYFIEKTFPVVYRIPDPIITDYKVVFERLFEKAFGKRDEQELINRCYRLKKSQPNIREIISFVNKLVSLSNQWGDSVKLSSLALFLLNQESILAAPEKSIVKREYLSGLDSLFEKSEYLDTEMAALAYGISKEDAGQLPMKTLISQALSGAETQDFADYATRSVHFFSILKEVINDMDAALLNNAIIQVDVIPAEGLNEKDQANLKDVWTRLAGLYLKSQEKETTFRKEVKSLMMHCSNKVSIGKHFIKLFVDKDNPHKGAEWYQVYKEVADFSKANSIELPLPEKQMENVEFVEYLRAAKNDYKNYPVKCDNKALNTFCHGQIANNFDVLDVLSLTKGDKRFEFDELKTAAKGLIENKEVTSSNLEPVLEVLKFLTVEPLRLDIDGTYLTGLQYEGALLPDYRVLLTIAGKEVSGLDDKDYALMAEVVFKYEPMTAFWEKCQTVNTVVLAQFTRYLIANNLHDKKVTTTQNVIGEMTTVVTKTGVDRQAVISYLNDWGRRGLTQEEEALDFASVLSQEVWIDAFMADKNDFAKAVLTKFYRDCGSKPFNQFVNNSNVWIAANYWSKVMKRVAFDDDFWQTKPENAAEIVSHLIEGICSGNIVENTMDESLLDELLQRVKFTDVSTKVNDVMDKYFGTYSISLYKFKKLHGYFEKTKNHEVVFLNRVLRPIIEQEAAQTIILNNQKCYEPLLKDNLEQASELKNVMIKQHGSSKNQEWVDFIDRLGVIEKKEEK